MVSVNRVEIKKFNKTSIVGEVFLNNVSEGDIEVRIKGIDVSGMTIEDAREMVASRWIALEDAYQRRSV